MSDRPSLWWAYDAEDNSFSALPAGPLLLPAVAIALIASVFEALKAWSNTPDNVLGTNFTSTPEYQKMRLRYIELINKKHHHGGLTLQEHNELEKLKRPWWIDTGTWSYWP